MGSQQLDEMGFRLQLPMGIPNPGIPEESDGFRVKSDDISSDSDRKRWILIGTKLRIARLG